MIKKLIIGTMILTGIIFLSGGSIFASQEAKPWESLTRFRGGDELSEMSKEMFHNYKDEHRENRMEAKQERLMAAVERGCITEKEMEDRIQTRKGRFVK